MNIKKTLNTTSLKKDIYALFSELEGDEALQVFQRNERVIIAITQKHYLELLNNLIDDQDRLNSTKKGKDSLTPSISKKLEISP